MSEHPDETLGARARAGARWAGSAYYANIVVRLGISVALARFLSPADFGLMALTMAFVGFVARVQDSGLSSALVQHPEPVARAASTVVLLTTTGGVLLAVGSWVLAPWVAAFMEAPGLTPVLRLLAILFVVRGMTNPRRALIQRALGFRTLAAVELTSTAAYGALGVALAVGGFGVWALVGAQIASELVGAAIVGRSVDLRLGLGRFSGQEARQLGAFGRHMVAASLLAMLHAHLPTVIVGKTMGADILGLYWLALRWASLPVSGITYVASRVAYPVYARLRHEPGRFASGYLRVLQTIVILAMPASLGLALVAEPLIATLYDARWQVAVGPLRLLAFYGLFAAVGSTTGEVFKGAGQPRYVTLYAVLYNVVLGASLLALGRYGLDGIAVATVLAPLVVAVLSLRQVALVLDIAPRAILALFTAPLAGTAAMAIVVLGVRELLALTGAGPLVRLVLEVTAGALAYGVTLYRVEPAWWGEAAATAGLPRLGLRRKIQSDVVH